MLKDSPTCRAFDLGGRIGVLTGAGGHLGQAIAAALAELGATVYLVGRTRPALDALCANLRENGGSCETWCADVRDLEAVKALAAHIDKVHGRLDVLINNAHAPRPGTIATSTAADFRDSYDIAVVAALHLVQTCLALLKAAAKSSGTSSVVNVASMYASVSPDPRIYRELPPNPPSYGPAKAGLVQLTRYLACSLGAEGIRVNALSPGPFPSETVAQASPWFIDALAAKTPLGRIGQPDDLKGAIAFLASDASRYVTGIELPVDGGWTAW